MALEIWCPTQRDVGDVLVAQGNLPAALKTYQQGLAIRDRLAKSDPGNAQWQYDLGISNERVGYVQLAQGNLSAALQSYEARHEIISRLAKSDPGNASWQRDLSVSYIKVGDVLVAQGNLPAALKSFKDSLAIRERLAQSDPGNAQWQYDLGISNERVGYVQLAQGNLSAALKSYEARHEIVSRLAKSDPGNMEAARSLGLLQQDRRRFGGAGQSARSAENLSARAGDCRPAGEIRPRQCGLAARSLCLLKVGDVLVAQGNFADALKSHQDSLAIVERLAASDPGNAGWQRDLSVL